MNVGRQSGASIDATGTSGVGAAESAVSCEPGNCPVWVLSVEPELELPDDEDDDDDDDEPAGLVGAVCGGENIGSSLSGVPGSSGLCCSCWIM